MINRLEYEKLCISTSYIKHQDYLKLSGSISLLDERTGINKKGGEIQAFVLSSNWSQQLFSNVAAGIDELVYNCATCLEAHNIVDGRAAFIIKSEFSGIYREYETRAFVDFNAFIQDALQCDSFITFLPFDSEVMKELGYFRCWGPDKRSYSIKCRMDNFPLTLSLGKVEHASSMSEIEYWPTSPLLNRLYSVPLAEKATGLSKDAKKVIELFKVNGNTALTKIQILQKVELNEDELSMAMLELLEHDLLDESESPSNVEIETIPNKIQSFSPTDFIQAVKSKNYSKVRDILLEPGFQVNNVEMEGTCALFIALEDKDIEMAKLLLEGGADPNYESEDGMTAIKLCWLTNNRAAEVMLREYGAELDM